MSVLLGAPRSALITLVIFSFFTNLLMLTVPIYMLQVFDRVLSSHSVETLILLTIMAVGALLTSAFLETIRSRLLMRLSNRLHGQWGRKLLQGSGAGPNSGGFRHLRDLSELKHFIGQGGVIPILDAPWMPLYMLILYVFHPIFAWLAIIGGLLIGAIVVISELRMRRFFDDAQTSAGHATLQADAVTKNSDTLQAMGMVDRLVNRWEGQSFSGMRQSYDVTSRQVADNSAARFVRMSVQICVLGAAAYLVTLGELTAGVMIAGSILITRALGPLEAMINGYRNTVSAYQAYKRLTKATESLKPPPTRPAERLKGKLTLDKVTVLADRKTLLNNVSLTVKAGEMIAVTGSSGAGKSMLVKTMLGLVKPNLGKAMIDDVDIGLWNADELGHYLGYLDQDAPLFQETVGRNIARLDPQATQEQISIAARRAYAQEAILRLPNGYETAVQDGAQGLPQGIRQRIAMARALFGDPRIVVLDEPESHLDFDGEQALMQTLSKLKKSDVTTIVVTHRPQILAGVDRVLRIENGVVQALGPLSEVMPQLSREISRATPVPTASIASKSNERVSPDVTAGKASNSRNNSSTTVPGKAQIKTAPQQNAPSQAAESNQKSAPQLPPKPAQLTPPANSRPPIPPRPPVKDPQPEDIKRNRQQARAGNLTLGNWLDATKGVLGQWITDTREKSGANYLDRLRIRFAGLLEYPLQEINEEVVASWQRSRVDTDDSSSIERAMQLRRFRKDKKVLLKCLSRAVEWRILDHQSLVDQPEGRSSSTPLDSKKGGPA